ncbi:MAG: carboxylesterase family protein [Pseudomonadota bacterium]
MAIRRIQDWEQDLRERIIQLDSGPIFGNDEGIYRGIPYAAPPVKNLRWKPPQPVNPWTRPRRGDKFGAVCPQLTYQGAMNEDCLFLNVWAPNQGSGPKLPVMVWIHGGAFITGSGSDELYDGAALARQGVVVVTFNYRLGALGFLAHTLLSVESPDNISGNYGLLDQVAALQWVQRHIDRFGGDPDKVTIFGQSAGAESVSLLLVNPLAQGLFHAAIAQSPAMVGSLRPLRQEQLGVVPGETVGRRIVQELGIDQVSEVLSALRQISWRKIEAAVAKLQPELGTEILKSVCTPTVDGYIIPDHPVILFGQGRRHPVPLITGVTANESTMFLPYMVSSHPTLEEYQQYLQTTFGMEAGRISELLPVKSTTEVWHRLDQLFSAKWFGAWANFMASTSQNPQQTWFYRFTRQIPQWATEVLAEDSLQQQIPYEKLGACHSAELFYVFGFTKLLLGFFFKDWALSEQIMTYWTNFAKSGNPNGGDLPEWPSYGSPEQHHYLEIGRDLNVRSDLEVELYQIITKTWLESAY